MMQPQTRREGEIWQACDDLWSLHASAAKLTGDAIRDQLLTLGYKRGSPNEIYKYRRSWHQSRGVDETLKGESSSIDSDPITRAVSLVHEQLKSQTNQRIDEMRLDFEKRFNQVNATFELLEQDYKTLQSTLGDMEAHTKDLQAENKVLKEQIQEETQQKDLLIERLKASNALIDEIKNGHQREVQKISDGFNERIGKRDSEIQALNNRITELGQNFSDEITAAKLVQHNLSIQKQEIKKKARLSSFKNIALLRDNKAIHMEKKSLQQELSKLAKENQNIREKWLQAKTISSALSKENKELSKQMKKLLHKQEKTK